MHLSLPSHAVSLISCCLSSTTMRQTLVIMGKDLDSYLIGFP